MDKVSATPYEKSACRIPAQLMPSTDSSYHDDLQMEWEHSLDDFDRELLAADLQGNRRQTDDDVQQWASRARFLSVRTHDNRQLNPRSHKIIPQSSVQDNLRAEGIVDACQQNMSSSPPRDFASSPTVLALRNKKYSLQHRKDLQPMSGLTDSQALRHLYDPKPPAHKTIKRNTCLQDISNAPPIVQGISLVPTYEMPDRLRSIFGFELFNAVQSKCFAKTFQTNDNLVISAPTGSGKTVIMELALCRLMLQEKSQDFKIVYQAPTRSLCSERYRDWTAKFRTLGLHCAELTGDVESFNLKSVQSAHVIITTPEKWDSVTRKWKDNLRLMQMIKLFLVDEVHILREVRGATLEAIVSRMKSIETPVRFVALSATIPNPEDVATWLGLDSTRQHLPAHCEVFDESFRPVQLAKHVIGYGCSSNPFAFDALLIKEIPAIIAKFSKGKPVLVFCATKATALRTASLIAKGRLLAGSKLNRLTGRQPKITIGNSDLSEVVSAGVAFHHGGLDTSDRQAVEHGFSHGEIDIICCTSTLAVGVNLPCYLVIIKGTSFWTNTGLQEYSSLDVMQMVGRAGRPQYEQSACAVILTRNETVSCYQKMVSGQEILESSLHQNLIEHLNAEIGIGTIRDVESAKKWLASSFLSVRLRQNPQFYQLQRGETDESQDDILGQICERDLSLLEDAQLIEQRNGFRCTQHGAAMARYYLDYETMLAFLNLPSKPKLSDVLNVVSKAHEFSNLKIRAFEKSMYRQINESNEIRFPIKAPLALSCHKASILIQARLGGVVIDRAHAKHISQFNQDSLTVLGHCNRLVRCIIDMQIHRGDADAVKNSLELCRSLAAGVWDNTPMQLKQVESVGEVTARKLVSAGIDSIEKLLGAEPSRIEVIMRKSQPFGSTLIKKAARLPDLRVSVKESARKKVSKGAEIRLKCEVGYLNDSLISHFNRKAVFICFLCESSDGKLIDFRRFSAQRMHKREEICLTVTLKEHCSIIGCHVMCDEIVGTHRYAELSLNLDQTWFPKKTVGRESLDDRRAVFDKPVDSEDFDDPEVADDDLLVAESSNQIVEVIEGDIDQIMADDSHKSGPRSELKRRMSSIQSEKSQHDPAQSDFREPKRLKNGKWTCRHTCNAEGKSCKHQCCTEGVTKPRRRPKLSVRDSKTKNAIKSVFTNSPTKAEGVYNGSIVDIDDICEESSDSSKLSFNTDHHHLSKMPDCDSYTGRRQHVQEARRNINTRATGQLESRGLQPSIAFMRREADSAEAVKHLGSDEYVHGSEFDIPNEDPDIADCDWSTIPALERTDPKLQETLDQTDRRGPMFDHTSLHNEDKTLSCEGEETVRQGSQRLFVSPSRTNQPTPSKMQSSQDSIWPGDDLDFFADLNNTEDIGLVRPVNSPSRPSIVDTSFVKSQPRLALHSDHSLGDVVDPSKTDPTVSTIPALERAEECEKRLHEENQRRLWAEFPPWMYEQFGAYVNLV